MGPIEKNYSKSVYDSKLENTISKNLEKLKKIKSLLVGDDLKNVIGEIIQDFNDTKRYVPILGWAKTNLWLF